MAYLPSLHRHPCTENCKCYQMSPDFLRTTVVYDRPLMENFRERNPRPPSPVPFGFPEFLDFWISDTLQELDPPPMGIIFKMPNWVLQGHQIQENTLAMRAFKVSSILIQNFVRRRYSILSITWPVLILDWHLENYLAAEQILIIDFNIPVTRAADLLPRLDPQFMGWRVRDEIYLNPGDVHFGVCDDHRHTDYEQFAQYLWRPWIPKDLYPNYDEEKNWDPNVV